MVHYRLPSADFGKHVTRSYTILAISGSLRARSSNTEILRAVAALAPNNVTVSLYEGLADLPHFNPDLDQGGSIAAPSVAQLRALVGAADAVLISSPEYAHGVPGSLKNALDWLVSGSEIPYKPVGLLNVSSRSTHAHASLAETLKTMSTIVVPEASITVALDGRRLDAETIAGTPEHATALRAVLDALTGAVDTSGRRAWEVGVS
jgi:NAD(P)H-dependent FMN reductase